MSIGAGLLKLLRMIWAGLDRVRKILHFILLFMFFAILLAAVAPSVRPVPASAALVVAPRGVLVEQLSGDPFERALARTQGLAIAETLLSDVIAAIRAAKDDSRIKALVLETDGLAESGLSKLQALAEEIAAFRETGKRVVALGTSFDGNQYYLAAQADDVYMHPMGNVLIDGYSRYLPYFKSALDRLYVDFNVWTVGEYKSFVEPVTRDDMSAEDRAASLAYLNGLWDAYQEDVTARRELAADGLQRYADELDELLAGAGGDAARLAADYGLVDELLTRAEMRARIREVAGVDPRDSLGYSGIGHEDYLAATRAARLPSDDDDQVAIVVASGEILDGTQPLGTIGGDSTAELIRRATRDESVEALVLRVDSPGGSAVASDIILDELEAFQATGRPLVVSMSSVAASGGYWISMSADEIWASPTTLTGSIGVGAMIPTFQRTLGRIGVNVDGVGTTELSGQFDVTRDLGETARTIIAETVGFTYERFISQVAEHRDRSIEDVDRVARGRVWTGRHAYDRGLVDELGQLDDAIEAAAGLAGLEEGAYGVRYIQPQLGFAERLALELAQAAAPVVDALGLDLGIPSGLEQLLEAAREPVEFAARFNDPRGIYAYCFCDVR